MLAEIAPHVAPGQLVVSLAAGITTDYIEKHLPDGVAVVRVMPNTPALVDEGMAAISAGTHCDEEHLALAEQMLLGHRPRGPRAGEAAGRGHRDLRLRSGLPVLRRRGDDRGRRTPRAAAEHRHRAGRPDGGRLGQAAARDRRRTRRCCASRSPRRAVRRQRRSAQLEDHKVRAAFITAMEAARDRSVALAASDD